MINISQFVQQITIHIYYHSKTQNIVKVQLKLDKLLTNKKPRKDLINHITYIYQFNNMKDFYKT